VVACTRTGTGAEQDSATPLFTVPTLGGSLRTSATVLSQT
jgi:hypothetical protein